MNVVPRQETEMQMQRVDMGLGRGEGGTNWEIRTDAYSLPCKQKASSGCHITRELSSLLMP